MCEFDESVTFEGCINLSSWDGVFLALDWEVVRLEVESWFIFLSLEADVPDVLVVVLG